MKTAYIKTNHIQTLKTLKIGKTSEESVRTDESNKEPKELLRFYRNLQNSSKTPGNQPRFAGGAKLITLYQTSETRYSEDCRQEVKQ